MQNEEELAHGFISALEQYQEDDFKNFASATGATSPDDLALIKDVVGIAGAFYETLRKKFSEQPERSELLRRVKKAASASRKLESSLLEISENQRSAQGVASAFKVKASQIASTFGKSSTVFRFLNGVFLFEKGKDQLKLNDLKQLADTLAATLEEMTVESFETAQGSRAEAIGHWVDMMSFFWADKTKTIPEIGHYYKELSYKEFSGHKSVPVTALAALLKRIDPTITERSIVTALTKTNETWKGEDMFGISPSVLMSVIFWPILIRTGKIHSSPHVLAEYMGMPMPIMEEYWASCLETRPTELVNVTSE